MKKQYKIALIIIGAILVSLGIFLIIRRTGVLKRFKEGKNWEGFIMKNVVNANNPSITQYEREQARKNIEHVKNIGAYENYIVRIINRLNTVHGVNITPLGKTNNYGLMETIADIDFNKLRDFQDQNYDKLFEDWTNEIGVLYGRDGGRVSEKVVRRITGVEKPEYLT